MRRRSPFGLAAALALLLPLSAAAVAQQAGDRLVGSWEGTLDGGAGSPGATVVHIERDAAGELGGTVDSPGQKVWGLPLSGVEAGEDGAIRIELAMTAGVFEGGLDEAGDTLRGTWEQRGTSQEFVLARTAPPLPVPAEMIAPLTGVWEGPLVLGAVELRMVLNLSPDAAGRLRGSFDSPDQGATGIPVTRCDGLEGGELRISIGSLGASFVCTLADGGGLSGIFLQNGMALPMTLERVEQATEVRRPQTPLPPFPYRAEEVEYENPADSSTFAGTLTLPPGDGPFPAALLITGSGPQDRDESIFQHRPFLVIADHLSRAGVAVLRVDDRGVGGTRATVTGATTLTLAGDAAAGVAFLRGREEIDPARVGLIGHSEGGVIAPMVAAEDPELAFIILMAGTGEVGRKILLDQTELLARVAGEPEEDIARNRVIQEAIFDAVLDPGLEGDARRARVEELLRSHPEFEDGGPGDDLAAVLSQVDNPWMRYFLTHDPAPVLERVTCPVLAMNGRLDLQVPWESNLAAIRAALTRGGNADSEVIDFPRLNHLFQEAETGLVTEYGKIEQTIAPVVLEKMEAWIRKRVGG